MKQKILCIVVLISVNMIGLHAMSGQKGRFKVAGKCGMCESRIERAALSVKGVESADWDKESGLVDIEYDTEKASLEKIQKVIASTGHDTELYTASDNDYKKLPGCCKYQRMEARSSGCCPGSNAKASCGSSMNSCEPTQGSSGCVKNL